MAFPLDRNKYVEVGAEKGLTLLNELAPPTVYDKCNWQCDNCGKKYFKTYRAVYLGKNGCRCKNSMSIDISRYVEVGNKYGLRLVKKANNYKEPSLWEEPITGIQGELSYYDITHAPHKAAEKFQKLGVNIEEHQFSVRKVRNAKKTKVILELNGQKITAPASMLTENSTPDDKERVLKAAQRRINGQMRRKSHYQLLNQEEEQGIVEIYDN